MHTLEDVKKELVDHLHCIDKEKLSIMDLKVYAEIVKIVDEIDRANKPDKFMELMGTFATRGLDMPYKTVDMKEV